MNCVDQRDGSGCRKCETVCANTIEQGSEFLPLLDVNSVYKCEICECNYSIIYYRHEAKNWHGRGGLMFEKENDSMFQPILNSFFDFKDLLKDMTCDCLSDVSLADDVMVSTAVDISHSSSLSENVQSRNVLPTKICELRTQSTGLSIAQLCEQKRKKRKVNTNKTTADLPIEHISSFDDNLHATKLASTVVTPLGTNNDSR